MKTTAIPPRFASGLFALMLMLGALLPWQRAAHAQGAVPAADAVCVVSALNRNATLDGAYYVIPGVPSQQGQYRVRAVCSDGTVGQTGVVTPAGGSDFIAGPIRWGSVAPIPKSLTMTGPGSVSYGQTVQFTVTGKGVDGATWDASSGASGTNYVSSNPAIASISANGVLTVAPAPNGQNYGRQVVISATNEGTAVSRLINIGPRGAIAGKVTQADGITPVAGAQVTIQLNAPLTRFAVQTTDAAGAYRLGDAPAGDYTLAVLAPASGARGSAAGTLAANGSTATFNIRLSAQGTVRVSATTGGQPVPSAQVTLAHAQFAGEVRTAETGADGVAVFTGFSAGPFSAAVNDRASGALATATATASANGVTELALQLQGAGAIAGRVLQVGAPQDGVQVRLLSAARGLVTQAVTAADGAFRFDALLLGDGPYTLQALRAGQLQGSVGNLVLAAPGQELRQDVQLGRFAAGGSVGGKVVNATGQRVPGVEVRLASANGQQFAASTDAQGVYLIAGVPLGAFTVTANANGLAASAEGSVQADGEQVTVDLALQGSGQVGGKVLLSNGQPAAGAAVELRHTSAGKRQVVADDNGQFSFGATPLGAYVLEVHHASGEVALLQDGLATPGDNRAHQVALAGLTTLRVTVTEGGVPKSGVRVALALRGTLAAGYEATTDAAGVAQFDAVPRAPYGLTAMRIAGSTRSFARADGELYQAEQATTLALTSSYLANYTVRGRVVDAQARPVADQWVRLSTRDMPLGGTVAIENPLWNEFLVRTDANGNYAFDNVMLNDDGRGRLKLDALVDGALRGRAIPTTPAIGATVEEDIVLYDTGVLVGQVRSAKGNPVGGASVALTTFDDVRFAAGDFTTQTRIDGRYAIVAPPRAHQLVARTPDRGASASAAGELTVAGQALAADLSLATAPAYLQVRIDSNVPAETTTVSIDGRELAPVTGSGNTAYVALTVGTHQLRASTSYGETVTRQVVVQAGDDNRIVTETVVLRPATLSVALASSYAGERMNVYVGNRYVGVGTPGTTLTGIPVSVGTHDVSVTADSGLTKTARIVVTAEDAGKVFNMSFAFNTSRLRIRAHTPYDKPVTITVNGTWVASGYDIDRVHYGLRQGVNEVVATLADGQTRTQQVRIDSLDDGREYEAVFMYQAAWMKVKVATQVADGTTWLYLDGSYLGSVTGSGEAGPFVVRAGDHELRGQTSRGASLSSRFTVGPADEGRTLDLALNFTPPRINVGVFNSAPQSIAKILLNGVEVGSVTGSGSLVSEAVRAGRNDVVAITEYGDVQRASVDMSLVEGVTAEAQFVFDQLQAKRGVLRFDGERHLYAVAVQPGDRLALYAHGSTVDGVAGIAALRWESYAPGPVLATTAVSTGEPFDYRQNAYGGNPQAIAVRTAGHHVIALQPDADGKFGGYVLSAAINGRPVPLLPYQDGGTVEGTVLRADGTPAAGAMVSLRATGGPRLVTRAAADEAGRYRFEHVPQGDVTLRVLAGERVVASVDTRIDATGDVLTHDLRLPPVTQVNVSVRVADALALPGALGVQLTDAEGDRNAGVVRFDGGRTSSVLAVAALGDSFTLSAAHPAQPDYQTSRTIAAADGQTLDVVLELAVAQYSGRVLNSNGTPVAWYDVYALRADTLAQLGTTRTDSQGRYTMALPAGIDVILRVYDARTQSYASVSVAGGTGAVTVPDIRMSGTAALTGLVRYDSGEPIADAAIEVRAVVDGGQFVRNEYGGADGTFRVADLPVGVPLTVTVTAGAFGNTRVQEVTLTTPGQVQALPDFVFTRGSTLTIRLLDGNRKPNDRLVRASIGECGSNKVILRTAQGVSELRAHELEPVSGLEAGPVQVQLYDGCAYDTDPPLASVSVAIVAGAPASVDLIVPILSGTMKYSDGRLVRYPNAVLTQTLPDGSVKTLRSLYEAWDDQYRSHVGRFDVVGLELGDYTLAAEMYTANDPIVKGTLTELANVKVDLVLPAPPYTGETSDVVGLVRAGGVPAPGVEVMLIDVYGNTNYVQTNEDGIYQYPEVPAGPFTVRIGDAASADGTAGTAPVLTLDLTLAELPYDGGPSTVQGTVTVDGKPAAEVPVVLTTQGDIMLMRAVPGSVTLLATTDAAGQYSIPSVPTGAFSVTARHSWDSATASGQSGTARAITLDLAIRSEPFNGTASLVSGTVSAENGPIEGAEVRLERDGEVLRSRTDGAGQYLFERVKAGPFVLGATYEGRGATANGSAGASQFVTVDLTLPPLTAGVRIAGVVRYSGGTAVADPSVSVYQNGQTYYATSDSAGNYAVEGIQPGTFELTAQDGLLSGLQTVVTGTAADSAIALDVRLPSSASVAGKAYDAAGQPLAGRWMVGVSSGAPDLERNAEIDAEGRYSLQQMALGTVRLSVLDMDSWLLGSETVTLATDGQTVNRDVRIPAPAGALTARVIEQGAVVPNVGVTLTGEYVHGASGQVHQVVFTDGAGEAVFAQPPAGPLVLVASAPDGRLLGMLKVTTREGQPLRVDLDPTAGATPEPDLFGADEWRYRFSCEGALNYGGTSSHGEYFPNLMAYTVDGMRNGCAYVTVPSADRREFTFATALFGQVRAWRRVWVPESGGFARFIDSFTNTGTTPVTTRVLVGNPFLGKGMTLVTGPAATAQTYALLDQPPFAQVSGGSGVAQPANSFSYVLPDPTYPDGARLTYSRTLTIAPGATVRLMHFVVQAGDVQAVEAMARALSNHSAPQMFDGIDAAEKGTIINFSVP